MSLFCPLKYVANVTESKGIQIMKIARISISYPIKIAILKTFCINPW